MNEYFIFLQRQLNILVKYLLVFRYCYQIRHQYKCNDVTQTIWLVDWQRCCAHQQSYSTSSWVITETDECS